jgi:hypothetical protein
MMLTRRRVVLVALALLASFRIGTSAAGQEATPAATAAEDQVDVLVVQSFASGRLEPTTEEPSAAVLTLEPPVVDAVYFSERPNRIVGTLSAEAFLEQLEAAAADPPNAVLIAHGASGTAEVVVELLRGDIDPDGTITYQVRILADFDEADLELAAPLTELPEPLELGAGHLVVDGLSQHKDNPT